jgi:predicted alpha/beta-fold hydrolase
VAVATTFLALICIVGITTTNRDGSKAAMYTVWAFSALSRGATRCRIVAPRQRQERLLQSPSPFALLSTISTATTEVETTPKRSSMSTKDAVTLKHMDYATTTLSSSSSSQSHKPAAIFLHGLLGNKRNFCSIGTSLSQQMQTPRRLIGLDLRNHGTVHMCI